jgi:hypothetical protein
MLVATLLESVPNISVTAKVDHHVHYRPAFIPKSNPYRSILFMSYFNIILPYAIIYFKSVSFTTSEEKNCTKFCSLHRAVFPAYPFHHNFD